MGIRISGSRLSLLFKCQYPFRDDVEIPEQKLVGRPAHTGVGFATLREMEVEPSRFVEKPELPVQAKLNVHRVGGVARADRLIVIWRRWWAGYQVANPMLWETEIPFAFDPRTGTARRLPVSEHRAYEGAEPHEYVGTADMVGSALYSLAVLDDKTGSKENVEPAKKNRQLQFLSMCHALVSGVHRGKVGLVFPHLDPILPEEVPFGPREVEAAREEYMGLPERISSSEPETGDHCRLCPIRSTCPGWRSVDEIFSGAVSSPPMPRIKISGKSASTSSVPTAVQEQPKDTPSWARPQTPEDNDFLPKPEELEKEKKIENVEMMSRDVVHIIERIYSVPMLAEYERLENDLRVGERRSDRGTLMTALDNAEDNARRAHQIYMQAILARVRWESETEIIRASIRSDALMDLESEKKAKIRTKDITDADVRSKMATCKPDEFRWVEEQKVKIHGMEKQCAKLADLWTSRCASLRAMLDKVR